MTLCSSLMPSHGVPKPSKFLASKTGTVFFWAALILHNADAPSRDVCHHMTPIFQQGCKLPTSRTSPALAAALLSTSDRTTWPASGLRDSLGQRHRSWGQASAQDHTVCLHSEPGPRAGLWAPHSPPWPPGPPFCATEIAEPMGQAGGGVGRATQSQLPPFSG